MAFEYLFASLPALPKDPGRGVALSAANLASLCGEEGGAASFLSRSILLEFDIKALERMEFGVKPSETAIFDEKQLRERDGLPHWLKGALDSDGSAYSYSFDRIWEAYFFFLMKISTALRSQFLTNWVSWEVGLRNAIASHRASRHKAQAEPLQIQGISKEHPSEFRPIIDELISFAEAGFDSWKEMDRTLNALRLTKARELAPEYTFDLNELLSYVAQFSVIRQGGYLS